MPVKRKKKKKKPRKYIWKKSFFPRPKDSPEMEYVFEVYDLTQQFVYSIL